jgi:hypothetical protein
MLSEQRFTGCLAAIAAVCIFTAFTALIASKLAPTGRRFHADPRMEIAQARLKVF